MGGALAEDRAAYRDTAVGFKEPVVADLEKAFVGVWDRSGAPLPDEERPGVKEIERAVAGGVGGALFAASLLGARFPRLVAWPLAAVGVEVGALRILRPARPAARDEEPEQPPSGASQGSRGSGEEDTR